MLARERQCKIIKMINQDGAVSVSELMKLFNVSGETVRRDIGVLEMKGKLVRVHGGAVLKGDMKEYSELKKRNEENSKEKNELAVKAASFLNDGDIISIDSGSTAVYFANELKSRFLKLTVITHSMDVFEILRDCDSIEIILCAGHYMKNENAFYGPLVLDTIEKLHIQKAFIFPSALSIEYGICDYQKDLYQVQKMLIEGADEIYVLADSSKFGKKALLKLSDMQKEYKYITDSAIQDGVKRLYEENGITIYN